jgi:hypothetical protein
MGSAPAGSDRRQRYEGVIRPLAGLKVQDTRWMPQYRKRFRLGVVCVFPPIVWTVSREMVGDPAVIAIRIAQLSGFQLCC